MRELTNNLSYVRLPAEDIESAYDSLKEDLLDLGAPPDISRLDGECGFWIPPSTNTVWLPLWGEVGEIRYSHAMGRSEEELLLGMEYFAVSYTHLTLPTIYSV